MKTVSLHLMPPVVMATLALLACGSGGKGGSTGGSTSGTSCTTGTKTSSVTADFTGSVASTFPLECATGQAYLSSLAYTDMTSTHLLELVELQLVFSSDASCAFSNGTVLDLSTTACVRIAGGAQVGPTKASFSNAPGYPGGTGTLTMTQWSVAKGGTVDGDFSNVTFPTIEPTDGGVNGQVVLNGSYSLVLP